jgi:hypothetical protein
MGRADAGALNEATRAELRALRNEVSRLHTIEAAVETERDEQRWLH